MRWKLDENFGSRTAHLFLGPGYDAETVLQERLSGSSDETRFEACIRENRCLLTLDTDFAHALRLPAHRAPGIAVLRTPRHPSLRLLEALVGDLLRFLAADPIRGRFWALEPGRVPVREDGQSKLD